MALTFKHIDNHPVIFRIDRSDLTCTAKPLRIVEDQVFKRDVFRTPHRNEAPSGCVILQRHSDFEPCCGRSIRVDRTAKRQVFAAFKRQHDVVFRFFQYVGSCF